MSKAVHLGFAVGTGAPVAIPIRHMVVTGQTQEAGKTTTLEALITRASVPAVAFVTKRGERSFNTGHRLQPYFRERADWQFVASVLEATLRERMKFERNWIIKASKGARTLADVHRNVKTLLLKAKGLSEGVYTTLDAYLEIVVPRVASIAFANRIDLLPGLNVVDLSDRRHFPSELQSLVMRSVLEWIYENADGAITIIPEAWEFVPQGRASPVKLSALELIRKGAGLHNYVWLDSQDIGGVDKELLRSCPVWLLGVQRETNEIKRTLDNIPSGIAKPKPTDVATLERGQFFACYGRTVVRTYVQPTWMTSDDARTIATGSIRIDQIAPPPRPTPPSSEDDMSSLEKKIDQLADAVRHLINIQTPGVTASSAVAPTASTSAAIEGDEEALYQRFKQRLTQEAPALLKVLATRPELQIKIERAVIEVDLSSARGMVAKLLSEGFLSSTTTAPTVWKELKRRWNYGGISARIYEQLDALTKLGFVTKEADGYRAVPDMLINIVEP